MTATPNAPRPSSPQVRFIVEEVARRIHHGYGDTRSMRAYTDAVVESALAERRALVQEVRTAAPAQKKALLSDPAIAEIVEEFEALELAKEEVEKALLTRRAQRRENPETLGP